MPTNVNYKRDEHGTQLPQRRLQSAESVSFNCAQMNINIQKFNKIYLKNINNNILP